MNQPWGTMPAIPQFRKHRKKDYMFKNRLKYIVSSRLAGLWNETLGGLYPLTRTQ